MKPEEINLIRQIMPEDTPFPYFTDRESLWLLAGRMTEHAPITELRKGALAPLIERPAVKPIVAACGGTLTRTDVASVVAGELTGTESRAALAGLETAWSETWRDYVLSFDAWASGMPRGWHQISRAGGNLVLQLGFPSEHARLLARTLGSKARPRLECAHHPVRRDGAPTLAWARLDLDLASGTLLIEELQCDWLRYAKRARRRLENAAPQSRDLRNAQLYEAELIARYGKEWAKALLLAVLVIARGEFGCRDIWLHTPEAGAKLKSIEGRHPPVSLYTALPKSFGFTLTDDAPDILSSRHRLLDVLRRQHGPIFWRLTL